MKKLLTAAIFCLMAMMAQAQEFTLFVEGFIPTGHYATTGIYMDQGTRVPITALNDPDSWYGGASSGWGAGMQVAFNSHVRQVSYTFDAEFKMGWTSQAVRDYFQVAPKYYNIPMLIGPRFMFDLGANSDIYFGLQIGGNIRIISDAIYNSACRIDYRNMGTFAFRASLGLRFYDHLSIEGSWCWLGDDYVWAYYENYNNTGNTHEFGTYGHLEAMQFNLRLGWTF